MRNFSEDSCGVPITATDCVLIPSGKYVAVTTETREVIDHAFDPNGIATCNRAGYEYSNLLLYVGDVPQAYLDGGILYLTNEATLVQFMPCYGGSYPRGLYYGIRSETGIYSSPTIQKIVNTGQDLLGSDYLLNASILLGATIMLVWYGYKKFRSLLY